GIRTILMPAENRKDTEDLPEEVSSKVKIHFVSEFLQAVPLALMEEG
ncbi:MAG: hypothetical protein J6R85_05685, partial [Lentisphaeria bacterium]|nr:hypothetical protein [Lentisphaeria bacterium]